MKVEPTSWPETKKIQIKFATTCKRNEEQGDAKNNAVLSTEWTKTAWETFEQNIGRGHNRSVKAWTVRNDD